MLNNILLLDSTLHRRYLSFEDTASYALIVNKIDGQYHIIKSRWGKLQTFDTLDELKEYVKKYMKE